METSSRASFPAPRRVMTAPVPRTADLPSSSTQSTNGLVETLYNHPNARIIAFSAQGRGRAKSPGRAQPEEEPGSLAWSSGLERTIAVGPFRIYRAPGSVAFLNCGSALQPILPKSQCWCIDEVSSKFVLQIRRPNYWRIEVPIESPHEQDLAQALRVVLGQILQFEKTACPFKRTFTVQLPERPQTPVVKKPWMPVYGPLPPLSTPEFSTSPTPTPKSLRSAEKKSLARRSSAAKEQVSWKESSDSEDNTSRTRSPSTSRASGAEEEPSLANPFDDNHSEEVRGRTLAREEDAPSAPQSVLLTSAEEDVVQGVQEVSEAEASTVESPNKADAVEVPETIIENIDEVSAEPLLEAPIEKIEEGPSEVNPESSAEDARVLSSETTLETEEPWSAHSVDTPKDVESIASPPEEPWSAHSTEPFLVSAITEPKDEDAPDETGTYVEAGSPEDETLVDEKNRDFDESDVNTAAVADDLPEASAVPIVEDLRSPSTEDPSAATDVAKAVENIFKLDEDQSSGVNDRSLGKQLQPPAPVTTSKRLSLIGDKYDGIRPYDQKSAAGTLTSLDVASRVTFETQLDPTPEGDRKSSSGDDLSQSSSQEEALTAGPLEGEIHEGSGTIGARRKKKLRGFHGSRSLAVPPQLTLVTSPPSKSSKPKQSPPPQPEQSTESTSPTGSQDSFHSVQSWHSPITPLPPSPPTSDPTTPSTFPYPHNNILMPKRVSRYEMSDLTVTPETRRTWDVASSGTQDSSQESAATAPDVVIGEYPDKTTNELEATSTALAPKRPDARHRATTSTVSRRALSPLPPAANLFSPTSTTSRRRPNRSPLELVRRVPMAIVAKTCEILLSPPSHLINLMLRVAARIAAGEWRGMVFGYGEGGEAIPVEWDYSDGELSDDDEYYMRRSTEASRAGAHHNTGSTSAGRSWEVD